MSIPYFGGHTDGGVERADSYLQSFTTHTGLDEMDEESGRSGYPPYSTSATVDDRDRQRR